MVFDNFQLDVRKCPECRQPLPESYAPPADEPWMTGIFGCAEDRESCKLMHDKLLNCTRIGLLAMIYSRLVN